LIRMPVIPPSMLLAATLLLMLNRMFAV
jgi:hypothetical protein